VARNPRHAAAGVKHTRGWRPAEGRTGVAAAVCRVGAEDETWNATENLTRDETRNVRRDVSRDVSRNARNHGSRCESSNVSDDGCRFGSDDECDSGSQNECRDENENRSRDAGCNVRHDVSRNPSLAASDDAREDLGRSGSRDVRESRGDRPGDGNFRCDAGPKSQSSGGLPLTRESAQVVGGPVVSCRVASGGVHM
jgi:hypothetical protein